MSKGKSPGEDTESNINKVFTKLQMRERPKVLQTLFEQLPVGDVYQMFIVKA